jgi:hypothetical protein
MKRSGVVRIAAYTFSIIFLILAAREFVSRGGPAVPRTIVSRTGFAPQESEEALALLERAGRVLPAHAQVTFLNPSKRSSDSVFYAVAVGQLPRHDVKPPYHLLSNPPPEFVIAFRSAFVDPRYRLIEATDGGTIYQRR